MLESLFGSINKERVLAYLFSNEEGYARGNHRLPIERKAEA